MYQPRYLVLEGISGCGKSALLHGVNRLSNYLDVAIMRFTPSMWVYNKLYGREVVDYEPMNITIQSNHDTHVVWLMVDPDEALRRKTVKGDLDKIEDLHKASELYLEYFDVVTSLKQVHRVETTGYTEAQVLMEIDQRIYG